MTKSHSIKKYQVCHGFVLLCDWLASHRQVKLPAQRYYNLNYTQKANTAKAILAACYLFTWLAVPNM